jgi:hypothetical protein
MWQHELEKWHLLFRPNLNETLFAANSDNKAAFAFGKYRNSLNLLVT